MIISKDKKMPFGLVTLTLVVAASVVALVANNWPVSSCSQLQEHLGKGYFMSWQAPNLILITRDKTQLNVQAEDKEQACQALYEKLKTNTP